MNWYVEPWHSRFIVRCQGGWGGLAILPAVYRDELCARMRAAELNKLLSVCMGGPLASFDAESQRERDLFDWAISRYGWREEGEFTPDGFHDLEAYEADLRTIRADWSQDFRDRENLLDSFQEWLERRAA